MLTKVCRTCKREKPIAAFAERSDCSSGLRASCKKCRLGQRHKWIKGGGKKAVDRGSYKYRETESYRKNYLKRTYGITVEDWEDIFNKQKGCCAVCGKHQSDIKKTMSVDHCHKTEKVRGLLCNLCNTAIGSLNDDSALLRKAAEYLDGYL